MVPIYLKMVLKGKLEIVEIDKSWCYIDNKGREWPCVEWDYEEGGYEKE